MIQKISIIGSGAVGSSLAFNLLSYLKFRKLALVDIIGDLAKGVALDLEDTRSFLNFSTEIDAGDDYSLIKDSHIIVFTAGIARKEGMTRLDLLKINAKVAKEASRKIKEFSSKAMVIAITNPLDIITYVIAKETAFNRNRVLGMGSSLDTARLLNILGKASDLSLNKLEGMVFGLHNNDMIVSANQIKIKGKLPDKFFKNDEFKKVQEMTALRGGQIVGYLKNKSAHFAPALSACRLIEAIANDRKTIIPVSVLLKGEYGLTDICVGVPCLVGKNGIHKIIELKLTSEENDKLKKAQGEFSILKEINI
jgi:malate dehydrogenase